jgi:hydrogenase nickel incorporation protein HypA/HybF
MHELSVCQGLLAEVERVARANGGGRVSEIRLAVGPLSGVEAPLLERAFTIARAGTCAADARLTISAMPVTVRCRSCGGGGEAAANRLLCPECGDWRVDLVSGNELQLTEVTLECDEPVCG